MTKEPEHFNFTQFAIKHGYPSDYDTLDHGLLSPSGYLSKRAKRAELDRLSERHADNRKAHKEFREAIERGEIVDLDGKITKEGIIYERRQDELKKAKADMDSLNNHIAFIESLGSMSHLKNGRLKAGYQRAVDDCRHQRDAILANYPELIQK